MTAHRHGHNSAALDSSSATIAARDEYAMALDSAQPDEGRAVVRVDFEAREIDWEFVPGQQTRAWAFGGQVPGPTIVAQVGDVLEIHLTNHLPEPTVAHWHGLRIPAAMDGTERVQRPIAPGETFTYRFRVPDAGTFWYHSHFNDARPYARASRHQRLSVTDSYGHNRDFQSWKNSLSPCGLLGFCMKRATFWHMNAFVVVADSGMTAPPDGGLWQAVHFCPSVRATRSPCTICATVAPTALGGRLKRAASAGTTGIASQANFFGTFAVMMS